MPQIQNPKINPSAPSDVFEYLKGLIDAGDNSFANRLNRYVASQSDVPTEERIKSLLSGEKGLPSELAMGFTGNLKSLTPDESMAIKSLILNNAYKSRIPMGKFRPLIEDPVSGRQITGDPGGYHGPLYEHVSDTRPGGDWLHGFRLDDPGAAKVEDMPLVPYPVRNALVEHQMDDKGGLLETMADLLRNPHNWSVERLLRAFGAEGHTPE